MCILISIIMAHHSDIEEAIKHQVCEPPPLTLSPPPLCLSQPKSLASSTYVPGNAGRETQGLEPGTMLPQHRANPFCQPSSGSLRQRG